MLKPKLFSVLILIMATGTQQIVAQYKYSDDLYYDNRITYEIGTSIGLMNCLTDLGGNEGIGKKFLKDFNKSNIEACGSLYFAAAYNYAVVLRGEATWGRVKANDDILKEVRTTTSGRYNRNLSFKSTIFEMAIITEFHPRYIKRYKNGENIPRFSPYLLGGIGFFAFNPQAKLDDLWVDLEPLSTEGQGFAEYPDRKRYKLKQVNFPIGAGFKYKISPAFNFSTECVYRILNTDYLDDVSTNYIDQNVFSNYFTGAQLSTVVRLSDRGQEINPGNVAQANTKRGNPKNNDAYFSLNFKIGYIF